MDWIIIVYRRERRGKNKDQESSIKYQRCNPNPLLQYYNNSLLKASLSLNFVILYFFIRYLSWSRLIPNKCEAFIHGDMETKKVSLAKTHPILFFTKIINMGGGTISFLLDFRKWILLILISFISFFIMEQT